MRIYEIFRKTNETYICAQINLDGLGLYKININILFLKHMLEQLIINSCINCNIISTGDISIDYHHTVEDLGVVMGQMFKFSIGNKKGISRYGYSYVPLDESLSRVIIDFCGRSYLKYNLIYSRLYIGNFDIDLFYDFFLAFSNNSHITLHIDNLYGENIHHKIETIFKSLGSSIKIAIKLNNFLIINSTKGILF